MLKIDLATSIDDWLPIFRLCLRDIRSRKFRIRRKHFSSPTLFIFIWAITGVESKAREVPFGFPPDILGFVEGSPDVYPADLDGDGDIDFVASGFGGSAEVAWFENMGGRSPAFRPHSITGQTNVSTDVHAADLDGDGDLDVIVGGNSGIDWYENEGGARPRFARRRAIPAGGVSIQDVATSDMNGDGHIDVVATVGADDRVHWYENDGESPPSFVFHTIPTESPRIDAPRSLALADLDADGDVDVIVVSGHESGRMLTVYRNGGGKAPVFVATDVLAEGGSIGLGVIPSDFDKDGDIDLIEVGHGGVVLHENLGAVEPMFRPRTLSDQGLIYATVGDFDADGDLDLIGVNDSEGLLLLENRDPAPNPLLVRALDPSPKRIVFSSDFNGDGRLDVIAARPDIVWYQNNFPLEPYFLRRSVTIIGGIAGTLSASDLDGDGDVDLFAPSRFNRNVLAWFENRGGPRPFFVPHVLGELRDSPSPVTALHFVNGPTSMIAADLDGDGHRDLVTASAGDSKIAWYESDGQRPPTFTQHVVTLSAEGACAVVAADLDDDGDVDVVSASAGDNTIAWYENDGGLHPSFAEHVISSSADQVCAIFVADLDSDGDLDVVAGSGGDHPISWYENDGNSPISFTPHAIASTAEFVDAIFIADLDSDGDPDVLSVSKDDDTLAWHENDAQSPPSFRQIIISDTIKGPNSVHAADLDSDGDIDVFSTASHESEVTWFENLLDLSDPNEPSTPAFLRRVITRRLSRAFSIITTDLNGDDDLDVIASSGFLTTGGPFAVVSWFDNVSINPHVPERAPMVFAASTQDDALSFGTLGRNTGLFAPLGSTLLAVHAMAYAKNSDTLYVTVSENRQDFTTPTELATLDPTTGQLVIIGPINISRSIEGLAFDADANVLYGSSIHPGGTELFAIGLSGAEVTPIASFRGVVGGLAFDTYTKTLYGIDDENEARLVVIEADSVLPRSVGALGPGISDVNALAFCEDDRSLYAIDSATGQLLRINPASGSATIVGDTRAQWGNPYAMACKSFDSLSSPHTVFDLEFDLDPQGWLDTNFSGDGSAEHRRGEGLCLFVPQAGENQLEWTMPVSQFIDLIPHTAYRVRFTMTTDQTTPDRIPIWHILYKNYFESAGILTWGGERWFFDNTGGSNGVGRTGSDQHTSFEAWITPAAVSTAQWNGRVDHDTSAFSVLNAPLSGFGLGFRVMDMDSAGGGSLGSEFDSGTICLRMVRVDAFALADLVAEGAPLFGASRYLDPMIDVLFISDNSAVERNEFGALTIRLGETDGIGRALVGFENLSLAGIPRRFPVLWNDGELLRLTVEIVDPRASSGPNPVDVIGLGWEAATDEIGGTDFISRGSAGGVFDRSASPRSIIETGGEAQKYISLFYTHNSTDADPTALPDGNRLRAVLDFFNRPDIAGSLGEGQRSDPLQIRSFVVERVTVGGGD